MATLLERRKHAIGNTFLNLQDESAVSKFEALWRLPGSSRLRAHSVGAIIHADSAVVVKSPCANADDHGSPRFPCALWCDLRDEDHEENDSQEVVLDRAQTAPTSVLESFAGSRFDINPSPADTSGATDITPTGGGLSSRWDDSLEQESAALPRLLGRAIHPSGSKAPTVISLQEDMDQGLFKTRWVGADQSIDARGVDIRISGEDRKELVVQKFNSPCSEVPNPQLRHPGGLALDHAKWLAPEGNDAVHEANGLSLQSATQDAFESPAEDNEVFEGDLEVMTLMIRNVPTDITQKDLMNELDASGFKDLYDFLYMPCCFNTRAGKGFAFLNLISVAAAAAFMTKWHKTRRFNMQGDDAPLNIAPAACQGLEANIKKWDAPRMRRIRNPDLRPFVAGRRLLTKGDASLQDSEVVLEASSNILPSNVHQDAGCDQAPISFIDASPGAPVYLNELARPGNDIMWSQTMPQCRMPNLVPQSGKASANHLASPMFDDYGDALQAPPGLWTVGAACSRLQNQSEPGAVAPLPAGPLAPQARCPGAVAPLPAGPLAPQASCPGAVAPLPAGPLAPQPSCPVTRAVFSTRPPCPPPQRRQGPWFDLNYAINKPKKKAIGPWYLSK